MGKNNKLKEWITPLTTAHFLLMINIGITFFIKKAPNLNVFAELGIVFIVPALIIWILPVMTLRKYGEISEAGSFMATTQLVDKGIYGIIRHPQYLAFMLLSVGIAMTYQSLLTIILSTFTIVLMGFGIKEEENALIEQFGDDYLGYKQKVPSVNLFAGIIRMLNRNLKKG